MRDDLFAPSRAERRQPIADWRGVPFEERLELVRRAKEGPAATDPRVSAAARGYGRYLLLRERSNRLPRSLLALAGAVVTVLGVLLWSGAVRVSAEVETGLGVLLTSGGSLATLMGLLSWSQRRSAAWVIAANPEFPAPSDPRPVPSGGCAADDPPPPEPAR